jgi:hypothetical protein
MKKHLPPFNKLTFKMTLIFLLLHMNLSHEIFFFEVMENGSSNCKCSIDVLNLGYTWQVREKKRWILTVGCFKGSHASDNMVGCVVTKIN